MEKFGYKEKENYFFEDESKCTRNEILKILNEAPEYKDFFIKYMDSFKENCFVKYYKDTKWEDEEYTYEIERATIKIIKMKSDEIKKLTDNENVMKDGSFLLNGNFEIIQIILTCKYDNVLKKHVYNVKVEYERMCRIKWDVYYRCFDCEGRNFFSIIHINNYYDARILHKYDKRQFWSELKFNDLPRFISVEASPLEKLWWFIAVKLAEKNWFFKDVLNDFEKYSGKYIPSYEMLWQIPVSFNKAIEFNSSKEFLAKYGKVTKSMRKLPIPVAFNIMKCKIKYEPIINHCVENIWLSMYFLYKRFLQLKFLKEKDRKETVSIVLIQSMYADSLKYFSNIFKRTHKYSEKYINYQSSEDCELVPDIFNMLNTLKEPVDFRKMLNENRAWKYHNELVKKINLKKAESIPDRKLKIHNNYERLIKAIGSEYELIDNEKRLYLEGQRQHNCVYSYLDYIERGEFVIFSHIDNNKRFTVAFYVSEGKYYINQLSGKYNSTEGTEKIYDKLNMILNRLNWK